MGSVGDSYDNALAETINGLYKAEVIHRRSWRNRQDVELATLDWVHWYDHKRLLGGRSGTSRQQKPKRLTIDNKPVTPKWRNSN
ncbi:ISXoc2 transposase, IS3 family [Xanthomonas arboricola pv. fragariae]|nr:ISXoc2 transposase, IS3 family [Xanthomonas arboricola pv. fragariae]